MSAMVRSFFLCFAGLLLLASGCGDNKPAYSGGALPYDPKPASPPDPHLESLVLAAKRIERRASLLNAEENLLHAQQQLAAALAASGLAKRRPGIRRWRPHVRNWRPLQRLLPSRPRDIRPSPNPTPLLPRAAGWREPLHRRITVAASCGLRASHFCHVEIRFGSSSALRPRTP